MYKTLKIPNTKKVKISSKSLIFKTTQKTTFYINNNYPFKMNLRNNSIYNTFKKDNILSSKLNQGGKRLVHIKL